jgi:uncharacterized lipoprotein YbaY
MKNRLWLFPLLAFSLANAQYAGAKRPPNEWRPGFESIREETAKEFLSYLAGPELRGRGSLTSDYWAAAGYVAGELRRIGVKPAGDGGTYFQRFDYVRSNAIPAETSVKIVGSELTISYGEEFQAAHIADYAAKSRLAFLNIPEKADLADFKWDQLQSRIVVYNSAAIRNPQFAAKLANLRQEHGMELAINANLDKLNMANPARGIGVKGMPDPRVSSFGTIRLSKQGARRLAEALGANHFLVDNPAAPTVELPSQEIEINFKGTYETIPLVNVIAKLEGSDPQLSKEAVLFGSHLDHMGEQRGSVLYGADDNASGCTANLMIARAFIQNPVKPKRTILFCFWAAEEIGTHGSFAYTMKPAHSLADTAAYINMDMLGRNEETGVEIAENNLDVVYPGSVLTTSRDFYDRLIANNSFVGLRFKPDKTDRTSRSDTRNFVWKQVPTVKIFTGEHPDYHRAGDTIDKINWKKLVNITKWLYLTAADLASRPDRPRFAKVDFVPPDHHVLSGRATFKEKIAIPTSSILRVELLEVGSSNSLVSKDFPTAQNRTPYELLVPKSSLRPEAKYELRFQILDGKRTIFTSASPVEVPASGWTRARDVELKLSDG